MRRCGPAPIALALLPQGNPAKWSSRDVARWLKASGLGSLTVPLRGVAGPALLECGRDPAAALPAHPRADRDALAAAVAVLQAHYPAEKGDGRAAASAPATPPPPAPAAASPPAPPSPSRPLPPDALLRAVIDAAADVGAAAPRARGCAGNAASLAALWSAAATTLAAAADAGAPPPESALRELLAAAEASVALVSLAGRQGWLIDAVVDALPAADFASLHDVALSTLQAHGLDVLPDGGRVLGRGAYRDGGRALRRALKRVGDGGLDAGLRSLADPRSPAVPEVAALLGVGGREVAAEAARLPRDASVAAYGAPARSPGQGVATIDALDHASLFARYDIAGTGFLALHEFGAALDDMGALDGVPPSSIDAAVARRLADADADGDGRVSLPEFVDFCRARCGARGGGPRADVRAALRSVLGPASERGLARVFDRYASFGDRDGGAGAGLDAARFAKLVREAGLLGRGLPPADVDLVFQSVVPKGARRLASSSFVDALAAVAARRSLALADVAASVLAVDRPKAAGVASPAYVRLHDDASTHTGVYGRGGPSTADAAPASLEAVVDRRAPADVRGRVVGRASVTGAAGRATARRPSTGGGSASGGPSPRRPPLAPASPQADGRASAATVQGAAGAGGPPAPRASLASVFAAYAAFGAPPAPAAAAAPPTLDSARFAKLVREAGLLGGALDAAAVDVAFAKCKPRGGRRVGFAAFRGALELLASERGVPAADLSAAVVAAGGPRANAATRADAVPLHDDVAAYTGTHARSTGAAGPGGRVSLDALVGRR